MVDSLSDEFRILASRYLNSVYERDDPLMSGSDDSDCSSASDESNHQKRKPGVPDAKKRGGLMKLAQSLSGGNRSGQHKSTAATAAAAAAAANKVKLKTEDVWDTPSPDSSETEVKTRKNSKSNVKTKHFFFLTLPYLANRLFTLSRRKRIRRRGKTRNRPWEVGI